MFDPEKYDFEQNNSQPSLETTLMRLADTSITEDGVEAQDLIDFAELQGDLGEYFGTKNHFIAERRITEYLHTDDSYEIIQPDSINGRFKDLSVKDIGEGKKLYARFITFGGADIRSPYRTLILEGYALIPIDSETSMVAVPESEEVNGSQFFDDDPHIQTLDALLLNGDVDLDDFEDYVATELSQLEEFRLEEYLKYATRLFENVQLELYANRVFFFTNDNSIEICSDEPTNMNGTIEGINLMSVTFEEEPEGSSDLRLSFAFKYNGVYFCILAEDVLSISTI